MSNTFGDIFFGSRPDMVIPDQLWPLLEAMGISGKVGLGPVGKEGKHDIKMARTGQIENMTRLRPVLSAINANKAASYKTAERDMGKAMAFSESPELHASMLSELGGKLDENASMAFADAAAGAYDSAANDFESARRYRNDFNYRTARDRAQIAAGSMIDRSRKGGIMGDLIKSWLNPGTIMGFGNLFGGGGTKLPTSSRVGLGPTDKPYEV
jgi:hypothetical protein